MGRAQLADPEIAAKAQAGRLEEVRPCIGCCVGCIHAVLALEPGGCVVNPDVGREYQLGDLQPAESPKRVLVVGAGPAGLAAARMAALRGHTVTVVEQRGRIGGVARLAAIPPGRGEVWDIVDFLQRELDRLKVEIRLNAAVDDSALDALRPEVAVLASGSLPEMPVITGLIQTRMTLTTVVDVLGGRSLAGDRVIVLGGGQAGLVLADFLAEKGKEVAVLNRRPHFAEEMSSNDRFYLRERLKRDGVRLYKRVAIQRFLADGVEFKSAGEAHRLEGFDTVVLAERMTPIREAAAHLKQRGIALHVVGDAKNPRTLMHCLSEGEEIGREI
jgi:NADPH-dependent 2,4-dienoyl-CoA reductase/sulfur reductase-like enzyme